MAPSSDTSLLFRETFEDHPITFVTFRGQPVVVARELGAALGYADPALLTRKIRSDWSDDFTAGEDYRMLDGADLLAFKAEWPDMSDSDTSASLAQTRRSLLILTESGLWMVAQKTEKSLGVKLRRFLADHVLPKLARGEAIGAKPGATVEPKPVTSNAAVAELRRVGDRLWRAKMHAEATDCYLRAGEIGLGRPFAKVAPAPAPVSVSAQLALPLTAPALAPTPAPVPPAAPESPRASWPKWRRPAPPDDGQDWSGFVDAWLARYGTDKIVPATGLLKLGHLTIESDIPLGLASRLGRLLRPRIDTVINGYRIMHRNSTIKGYALRKV